MDDEELAYWGQRGRGLKDSSPTVDGTLAGEVKMLWKVLGAIIERMDLE